MLYQNSMFLKKEAKGTVSLSRKCRSLPKNFFNLNLNIYNRKLMMVLAFNRLRVN